MMIQQKMQTKMAARSSKRNRVPCDLLSAQFKYGGHSLWCPEKKKYKNCGSCEDSIAKLPTVLLTNMASYSLYAWIKWLSLRDFESSFLWILPTFVGKYINLNCYRSNFDAEASLDIFSHIKLGLLHISSDLYVMTVMYRVTECCRMLYV